MSNDLWKHRSELQEFHPGAFISNTFGSRSKKKMDEKGITHVLVCGNGLEEAWPDRYVYKRLALNDDTTEKQRNALREQLDGALDFVANAIDQEGGKVLVHCAQGRSRSGALAAAIIMQREGLKSEEAIEKVQQVRPIVDPNKGFREVLKEYEAKLGV